MEIRLNEQFEKHRSSIRVSCASGLNTRDPIFAARKQPRQRVSTEGGMRIDLMTHIAKHDSSICRSFERDSNLIPVMLIVEFDGSLYEIRSERYFTKEFEKHDFPRPVKLFGTTTFGRRPKYRSATELCTRKSPSTLNLPFAGSTEIDLMELSTKVVSPISATFCGIDIALNCEH
jgi:hypothetical protein